jgi:hypothetical protein
MISQQSHCFLFEGVMWAFRVSWAFVFKKMLEPQPSKQGLDCRIEALEVFVILPLITRTQLFPKCPLIREYRTYHSVVRPKSGHGGMRISNVDKWKLHILAIESSFSSEQAMHKQFRIVALSHSVDSDDRCTFRHTCVVLYPIATTLAEPTVLQHRDVPVRKTSRSYTLLIHEHLFSSLFSTTTFRVPLIEDGRNNNTSDTPAHFGKSEICAWQFRFHS